MTLFFLHTIDQRACSRKRYAFIVSYIGKIQCLSVICPVNFCSTSSFWDEICSWTLPWPTNFRKYICFRTSLTILFLMTGHLIIIIFSSSRISNISFLSTEREINVIDQVLEREFDAVIFNFQCFFNPALFSWLTNFVFLDTDNFLFFDLLTTEICLIIFHIALHFGAC